jgi:hypothetical protein
VSTRPTLSLDKLPYKHRFDAATLLASKANNLRDASVVGERAQKKNRTYVRNEQTGELVDVGLVLAALSYFDMALLLMRSFDPNYRTVANWKCNALCSIGQYADAVNWYEEIVRVDREQNGGTVSRNATTALAQEQLAKYRGRSNVALTHPVDDTDNFIAPPFTLYAQGCLTSLAKRKFADAALHFAPEDRKTYSAKLLKQKWIELVGTTDFADVSIVLQEHLFEWRGKLEHDLGWCYFSVSGPECNEGVSFVVRNTEHGGFAIHRVEFGRP